MIKCFNNSLLIDLSLQKVVGKKIFAKFNYKISIILSYPDILKHESIAF